MIVSYSNTDRETNVLECIAKTFVILAQASVTHHLGRADGVKIRETLTSEPRRPFVFFGHGGSKTIGLKAHDGSYAVDASNCDLLQNRLVFAICCHSANGFAQAAQAFGATVAGFDGYLVVPALWPYRFDLETCILAGLERLLKGETAGQAVAASVAEFRETARRLFATMDADNVSAAAAFRMNAMAHRLVGDASSKL